MCRCIAMSPPLLRLPRRCVRPCHASPTVSLAHRGDVSSLSSMRLAASTAETISTALLLRYLPSCSAFQCDRIPPRQYVHRLLIRRHDLASSANTLRIAASSTETICAALSCQSRRYTVALLCASLPRLPRRHALVASSAEMIYGLAYRGRCVPHRFVNQSYQDEVLSRPCAYRTVTCDRITFSPNETICAPLSHLPRRCCFVGQQAAHRCLANRDDLRIVVAPTTTICIPLLRYARPASPTEMTCARCFVCRNDIRSPVSPIEDDVFPLSRLCAHRTAVSLIDVLSTLSPANKL